MGSFAVGVLQGPIRNEKALANDRLGLAQCRHVAILLDVIHCWHTVFGTACNNAASDFVSFGILLEGVLVQHVGVRSTLNKIQWK